MRRHCGWALATCVLSFSVLNSGMAAEALRVCLQRHDEPLSWREAGMPRGFDVALSDAIAHRLGRPLAIQWFLTRDDPDSDPVKEADALLSDGRCELVAGYALASGTVGPPAAPTGKLPPFDGASPDDRRRWIKLHPLISTRPYRFDALVVVLSPAQAGHPVQKLGDLGGLKLGVQTHSLPDLIAMSYAKGELVDDVVHFPSEDELLTQLEANGIDAGFIDLHQYDQWRRNHPGTRIALTGYTHSIGLNIGFVALATNQPLVVQVNRALSELKQAGTLESLAKANGLTYRAPHAPDVAPDISPAALSGD